MTVFQDYARYYNLLYRDKDYAGEARFVHERLQAQAPGARSLLELGCGTGAHARHLAQWGYEIHGVELSTQMLALAEPERRRQPPALREKLLFSQGDIRTIRLPGKFDAVIALFHVMSYQTTDADLLATLATARAHLQPGGVFLFDYWYGPAVLTARPGVRIKRLQDDAVSLTRLAEPALHANENVVDVAYQVWVQDRASGRIEEFRELHRMRYLFKPEIDRWLAETGLAHAEFGEWLTGREPGCDTWNVYSVGKY